MKRSEIKRRLGKLTKGDLIEVLWLDSGRDGHDPNTPLVNQRSRGLFHALTGKDKDQLVLCTELAEDRWSGDQTEEARNNYGIIWTESVMEIRKLRAK